MGQIQPSMGDEASNLERTKGHAVLTSSQTAVERPRMQKQVGRCSQNDLFKWVNGLVTKSSALSGCLQVLPAQFRGDNGS